MIVIGDPFVSRQHARVIWRRSHYFLEPLASRNGTFINDRLITRAKRLVHGQQVRVAHINLFVFEQRH